MGIEQNLERIAVALEKIAQLNEGTLEQRVRITRCAEFNAVRNGMKVDYVSFPELNETASVEEAAAPAEDPPKETEWTYDNLKAALIARGVEIPPRTKMTTLLKLWEQYKDAPLASAAPAVESAPAEEPAVLEDDIFGESSPSQVEAEFAIPCDLAPEKAREIIARYYDKSEADKERLLKSLTFVDSACNSFLAIPSGKHGVVAARFLELKGVDVNEVADIVGDAQ